MSHYICVSVWSQPAHHVATRVFIEIDSALHWGYAELEDRAVKHWFHAYPLNASGTSRIFTGNVEDKYLHSIEVWTRYALDLWGLSTAGPELAPPATLPGEHCCTETTRCARARRLAELYWQAHDAGYTNLKARAARQYERHLRHRKAVSALGTITPTRPDTWKD